MNSPQLYSLAFPNTTGNRTTLSCVLSPATVNCFKKARYPSEQLPNLSLFCVQLRSWVDSNSVLAVDLCLNFFKTRIWRKVYTGLVWYSAVTKFVSSVGVWSKTTVFSPSVPSSYSVQSVPPACGNCGQCESFNGNKQSLRIRYRPKLANFGAN